MFLRKLHFSVQLFFWDATEMKKQSAILRKTETLKFNLEMPYQLEVKSCDLLITRSTKFPVLFVTIFVFAL